MKLRCVALALIIPLTGCGESESAKHKAEVAEAIEMMNASVEIAKSTEGPGKPPVWTLSDEDTTIHVFGTFHILPPEANWRSVSFDQALENAHTLYTETDTDSAEAEEKLGELIFEMMQDNEGKLSDKLSTFQYGVVEKAAKDVGVPMASLDGMSPEWAAMTISMMDALKQGYDDTKGVETIAESEARAAGKDLGFLESLEFQFNMLSDMSMEDQVDMLVGTAATINEGREYADTMLDEWLDGDVAGIGAMITPEMFGSGELYDVMLTNRNKAWVPQIEAMLDEPGTVLVAVGAAHLAGPDSVITMLRDKGHVIEGP